MRSCGSLRSILVAASIVVLATASLAPATERDAEKRNVRAPMPSRLDAPKQDARTPAAQSVEAPKGQDAKDHPVRVRTSTSRPPSSGGSHDAVKVNINTADVKQLMTLTGVGRKVAENIVEYRDTHGPFKKVDELKKVDGVGTGLWEKNRDRIVTK
jgi:competence ComEA-like helix-hairpin-helix protein